MSPSIALLVWIVGVVGLFYLDADKSIRTSAAVWLPIIWLSICGSRSPSNWFGYTNPTDVNASIDGTQPDRLIFQMLVIALITVLFFRAKQTGAFLKANWPILIYLFYCLVSALWSDYPEVTAKRWFKAVGDLAIVLIIVTDAKPVDAFKRVVSRVGILLLPASILVIKYFPQFGRGYTPEGGPMNTGVAQQKNSLGVMTLVITLGTLWNFLSLLRDKDRPNRGRHLLVQGVLLAFGVWLLVLADSATSTTCFGLGAGLMLATRLRTVRRAPAAVHVLVLSLLLVGGLTFFVGGAADVTHALGRSSNLTGRTDIWAALIPAVPNKIVGAGFENFWIDYSVRGLWHSLPTLLNAQFLNEAHNGYVEIYLNLGWVGVSLIALVLITGYGKVVAAYRRDPPTGSLWMAYLIVAAFYNITEAGFRILNTMEIFLFMAVVYSSGIASGLIGGTVETAPEPVSLRSFHARQQKRLGLPLPVKRAT